MEHIVIGTAGHVDHGKTTLIKALTGMETDTTKEEKKRGLSINLGYAYFDLPNGKRAGIVDVPGHEKFIKNMMAGLSGLNLVLLVIDGSEGIMPQTKEHVDILQMLGVTNFLIVLTKVSQLEEELLELVQEDIQEQFLGTALEEAPIFQVDSIEGIGIAQLIEKINQISEEIKQKSVLNPPKLNVDRAFTVKGFGTIVTGTLMEGKITVNEELMLYPSEQKVKIRTIQVHEQNVSHAVAGMRTALNLANVKTTDVKRGDLLALPNTFKKTWMLDVKAELLEKATSPIKLWDRLRLFIGTREILCRVVPIGTDIIEAAESGFLQLRLEEEVVSQKGDRFILRTYSPMETIGGGIVLDANPQKHRRFHEDIIDALKTREKGSTEELVSEFMTRRSDYLTEVKDIAAYLGIENVEAQKLVEKMIVENKLISISKHCIHPLQYKRFEEDIISTLDRYHKTYRLRTGIGKEELRSKIASQLKGKEFDELLKLLKTEQKIAINETISLFDFKVTYNVYQLKDKEEIEAKLKKAGFTPPSEEQLIAGKIERKELIDSLVGKTLIRLDHENVIHREYYEEAINKTQTFITENGKMTLGEFRDITGSSRRYSMLILECLDKHAITKRVENYRVLVE
ncbi:selenocysteine-specific translation elongation factor [Enterococcus rivorum]|uniref:Selenocysteine-specific elongation factor n=1 Tax=Enterococcus rivorum TaxID=762845 RepID=A0A1E5KW20_9ENTE|nr:selenocysteine-specific translation elongation factor [Enterococcus rivorum]MBP2100295.1 selenocysteine-specific elongation factor [Enterococcus rivorum]OEH82018.1 selenocysteine-specific translation elongation factor [Enterococcus rivorum]